MAKRKTQATKTPSVSAPPPAALPPDSELTWIINVDTGEKRQVVTRAGYAPAPMPFGFRLARDEEIPGQ